MINSQTGGDRPLDLVNSCSITKVNRRGALKITGASVFAQLIGGNLLAPNPASATEGKRGSVATKTQGDPGKKTRQISATTPEMFGAKGDGISDDTLSLQNALNSGSLIELNRTYAISAPIYSTLDDQIIEGTGSLIAIGPSWLNRSSMLILKHKNLSLRNLTFDGSNKPIGAILGTGCQGAILEKLTIINTGWLGVRISKESPKQDIQKILIKDIRLKNNGHILPSDGWSGIRLENATDARVYKVTATEQYGKAISFSECKNCTLDTVLINNSKTKQQGIYFARGRNNTCINAEVKGLPYPIKLSRKETGSTISNSKFDSSGFGGKGYATVLFQGTSQCKLLNCVVISGSREGVMFETHPANSDDPYTPSDSIGNSMEHCTVSCSDQGARYLVYFLKRGDTRSQVCKDNSISDSVLDGQGKTLALFCAGGADGTRLSQVKGNGATQRALIVTDSEISLSALDISHSGLEALYSASTTPKNFSLSESKFQYKNTSTTGFADIRSSGIVTIRSTIAIGSSGTNCASFQNASRLILEENEFRDSTRKSVQVSTSVKSGVVNGNSSSVPFSTPGIPKVSLQLNRSI